MKKQAINPWTWQDRYGYAQAILVTDHGTKTVYAAGQGSVDADGNVVHAEDLAGQAIVTMQNVATVLAAAGLDLADVVRYELHTTDLQAYFTQAHEHVAQAFVEAGVVPAGGFAVQVPALALPGMALEVTVTAVR